MMFFTAALLLLLQTSRSLCNTEKVIFIAPAAIKIPTAHPTIEDLHIHTLTPHSSTQQTHIRAEFPTNITQKGAATWLLLDKLQAGQRYEVRVCWAATQPTSFSLDVYGLEEVFGNADLITSLAQYSATRQPDPADAVLQESRKPTVAEETTSILFLQILAAADYYTMDQSLMKRVPPVHVDIILDPFLFNVFPKSLVPTAIYITLLAIGAWFLSKFVSTYILRLQEHDVEPEKKKS